jgi:hypothetical protein
VALGSDLAPYSSRQYTILHNGYGFATNSVLPEIVLVRRSHWPGLELLIRFEVVPSLATIDILHTPSRMVRLELQVVIFFQ